MKFSVGELYYTDNSLYFISLSLPLSWTRVCQSITHVVLPTENAAAG